MQSLSLLRSRSLVAWLAGLAILFGSLAPSVAQAFAALEGQGGRWSEICTVNGVKLVQIDDGSTSASGEPVAGGLNSEHCRACLVHFLPGLEPASAFLVFTAEAAQHARPYAGLPPLPRVAWASAQPRAPPFSA